MTAAGSRFRPRPDVRFRLLRPDAVVLRQAESEVLVLNEVGGRILELLDAGRSLAETAQELAREFEVDAEAASRDLEAFVGELVAARVVEEA